jgi:hypothetical protein
VTQQLNIRNHVPIVLDLHEPNYSQWRCFFDSVLGKFGLGPHVFSPPPLADRDADWLLNDHAVANWLYTTIAKSVFDNVYKTDSSAFTVWTAIEGLFRDNEMERAVYLEAELRTLQQGELSINDYCTKLKTLADGLRDVDLPVSEPSQVLNLLCGLNPKYKHLKPTIKAKFPPHTFASARYYLLLEELCEKHDAKEEAGQALYAGHNSSPGSGPKGGDGARSSDGSASGGSRNKNRPKKRGNSGSGNSGGGSSGSRGGNSGGGGMGGQQQLPSGLPWAGGYNPWTGLVQAWPMNFRAPGAGVLGPRPPFQQQNAMLAQGSPASPQVPSSTSVWDQAALYSALSSAGVNAQLPPSSGDWYMDTGASSHITNMPGHFSNPHPLPFPTYITVGNGARLPVTHTAATSIPTNSSSLHLNNILVSPSIVKNLVSVRQLTRDNNVSIEFDPVGFSVKDLPTKTVILRCESSGALYPLRLPPQLALSAPRRSICGMHGSDIRGPLSCVKFFTRLIFVVIKLRLTPATPVELVKVFASHFLIPLLALIFLSS